MVSTLRRGSLETASNGSPPRSTNLTPVGMNPVPWPSPRSICPPHFHS